MINGKVRVKENKYKIGNTYYLIDENEKVLNVLLDKEIVEYFANLHNEKIEREGKKEQPMYNCFRCKDAGYIMIEGSFGGHPSKSICPDCRTKLLNK